MQAESSRSSDEFDTLESGNGEWDGDVDGDGDGDLDWNRIEREPDRVLVSPGATSTTEVCPRVSSAPGGGARSPGGGAQSPGSSARFSC